MEHFEGKVEILRIGHGIGVHGENNIELSGK
jgi:hypothetical protein